MNKNGISKFAKSVGHTISRHSPEILTGLGIAGMVTTTVLAVRATPKALELIDRELDKREDESNGEGIDPLTPVEVIKTCWKCYIPATVSGFMSAACIIGASKVNLKRNAALATAYTLSETAMKEYHDKVIETIGEKKEKEIQDAIVKDHIDKNPVTNKEVIITGKGGTLCFDTTSGRYFESDIESLRKIENDLNFRMRDEMYISLNDFYYEVGLPYTEIGGEIGWNIDRGCIDINFSAQMAEDGRPCIAIKFNPEPRYDYYKY